MGELLGVLETAEDLDECWRPLPWCSAQRRLYLISDSISRNYDTCYISLLGLFARDNTFFLSRRDECFAAGLLVVDIGSSQNTALPYRKVFHITHETTPCRRIDAQRPYLPGSRAAQSLRALAMP